MNTLSLSFAFIALVAAISWPLGRWLFWTLQPSSDHPRIDGLFQLLLGKGSAKPSNWKKYFLALLAFNGVMFAFTWLILTFQHHLPLNPDDHGHVDRRQDILKVVLPAQEPVLVDLPHRGDGGAI